MTQIKILTQDSFIVAVECSGHSGYNHSGYDIVCASISSIIQSTALGLMKVLNIAIDYNIDEDKGQLIIRLPENISSIDLEKSQILLNTMKLALLDIQSGYPRNIKVEVKTNVY